MWEQRAILHPNIHSFLPVTGDFAASLQPPSRGFQNAAQTERERARGGGGAGEARQNVIGHTRVEGWGGERVQGVSSSVTSAQTWHPCCSLNHTVAPHPSPTPPSPPPCTTLTRTPALQRRQGSLKLLQSFLVPSPLFHRRSSSFKGLNKRPSWFQCATTPILRARHACPRPPACELALLLPPGAGFWLPAEPTFVCVLMTVCEDALWA